MNKKQLIDSLSKVPDTMEILLASDAEGNQYSSVEDLSTMLVDKAYAGGRTEDLFDAEDLLDDSDEDDPELVTENFTEVLVLWPV